MHQISPFEQPEKMVVSRPSGLNWIFCIPSFWGGVSWTLTALLYIFGPIDWRPPGITGILVLVVMALSFFTSFIAFAPSFKKLIESNKKKSPEINLFFLIFLHLVGLGGAILFVFDLQNSDQLNDTFLFLLVNDPLAIRKASLEGIERGIYLNYLGWFASVLTGLRVTNQSRGRVFLLSLVLVQFIFSLVFLNKTRPIAIIILTIFGILVSLRHKVTLRHIFRYLICIGLVFSLIFVAWSARTGKVWSQSTNLHPAVETLFLYLTVGYPYLLHIVETEPGGDYVPVRVLRPFFTLSSIFFHTKPPPSSILPFYEIPFATNVGTALEPFYRDGGMVGLCIGFLALSAITDFLALIALTHGRVAGYCFTIILLLSSASSFFAPKMNAGPVFLFMAIFFISKIISYFRSTKQILIKKYF